MKVNCVEKSFECFLVLGMKTFNQVEINEKVEFVMCHHSKNRVLLWEIVYIAIQNRLQKKITTTIVISNSTQVKYIAPFFMICIESTLSSAAAAHYKRKVSTTKSTLLIFKWQTFDTNQ